MLVLIMFKTSRFWPLVLPDDDDTNTIKVAYGHTRITHITRVGVYRVIEGCSALPALGLLDHCKSETQGQLSGCGGVIRPRLGLLHLGLGCSIFAYNFFSLQSETKRTEIRFACVSLVRFEVFASFFFAIFAYFRITSFFVFALFHFINFLLNIFSSPFYFGVTLRQKYQFVRPDNNTKAACAIVTISLKTRPCTRPPFDRVKNNNLADFLLSSLRGFLYEFFSQI